MQLLPGIPRGVGVPCCRTWRPSENYLVQFTAEQLSDQELYKIWDAYDVNGDGKMDREELSFLMEDLCEVRGTA